MDNLGIRTEYRRRFDRAPGTFVQAIADRSAAAQFGQSNGAFSPPMMRSPSSSISSSAWIVITYRRARTRARIRSNVRLGTLSGRGSDRLRPNLKDASELIL